MRREADPRSIAGKAPRPERHVAVVVVGSGAAGVAAAVEAAGAGVEVLLVDENPVDNDTMAMDVPLYFGQRMQPSVRNRALMLERVVESNPALTGAYEAGVDVQLGTCVWGAFVNGPTMQQLDAPMLGLADERRSWLVGYDRLIVAAGARDVVLGFPGWERAGVMGANALFSLLTRYRALAARRMIVLGSGSLGLRTATRALEHGVDVAAIVEVAPRVRGDAQLARALQARGVPILTSHTVREARGPVGEVESLVVVRVDDAAKPVAGGHGVRRRGPGGVPHRRVRRPERLRQDLAHPNLARQIAGRARTPSECRGEKQHRASKHFPDGLDNLLSTAGRRDVDDDEVRFSSLANRLGQPLRGFNDNGIACLVQPALEQAKNQVVWFDDKYAPLLLHDTSSGRSLDSVPIRG